ncbi:hypothetical protein KR100_10750 [Synechococcus sp. KORDI-100]|nr:hypothetical protein KR100_10750 [Synechococcus sp. KORDI-100]
MPKPHGRWNVDHAPGPTGTDLDRPGDRLAKSWPGTVKSSIDEYQGVESRPDRSMTKLIRNRSMVAEQGPQERFLHWWRGLFKKTQTAGDRKDDRTERPFMFWDLSDG